MAWFDSLRAGVSTLFSNRWSEWGATVPVTSFLVAKSEPVTSGPEISSNNQTSEHNARSHDVLQCSQASKHSIFLSHSGAQKAFVDQLYSDFKDENLFPFFDLASHCLRRGEEFSSPMLKAAKECKVAIFLVTEQFLTSKWPMLELLTCIEAQKNGNPGLKLFPVLFDGLEFKDLQEISRWEKTWETLEKLTQGRSVKITVENCKEAVRKLRSTLGLKFRSFPGSEKKLRKAIVKDTLKLLPLNPDIDTEDIKGVDRLCKVLSEMFQESDMHNKGVQYLGLYGMGGLGKTSMCKALYSHFWSRFSPRVCILDIGIASRKLERQKDLLTKFTKLSKRAIRNIKDTDAAKKTLKEHLKEPVFLAVDNVQDDEASRQEARDYLKCVCCEGSIVLMTSRSRVILEDVLSDPECCKPVPTLTEEESMELFLQIAIPNMKLVSCDKEHIQILREICTQHCFFSVQEGASSGIGEPVFKSDRAMKVIKSGHEENGHYHPLAMRAVASFLHDRFLEKNSMLSWDGGIMLPHSREDIFSILAPGFDSLSNKAKQLFIDVALFAPPLRSDELYDWLLAVHEESDNGVVLAELSKLDRKSFLSFKDKRINMHDLYKEFGKRYIKEQQHYDFGIYHVGADIVLCPDWSLVPRISFQSCKHVHLQKLEAWTNVVVVHLVCCEGLYYFPLGDLVNLKQLVVKNCPQLEVISWHRRAGNDGKEYVPEGPNRDWIQLRFVGLLTNCSLRSIPDFSECSNLQILMVDSPLVKPVDLTSCPALETLQCGQVQSLQYCPKLKSARTAWEFGRVVPKFENLPSLLELKIIGPGPPKSIKQRPNAISSEKLFLEQYPEAMEDLPSPEIGNLTKLHTLYLQQLPMGKLPAGLGTWGSNLQNLNLSGSLLSQLVNFSALSNLQKLSIAETNVKEVRGIGRLTKIESLDFSNCFRLQKLPDLNRLSKLEFLSLSLCTRLKRVPRVPPEYHRGDEFKTRLRLGLSTGVGLVSSHKEFEAKLLEFRSRRQGFKSSPAESALHSTEAIHRGIECDGCGQLPLRGPRFKAKEKIYYSIFCSTCCTNRCDPSKCQATRSRMKSTSNFNYDLCRTCFRKFGGNAEDFMRIDKTDY